VWGLPPWFDPDLLSEITLAGEGLAPSDAPDTREVVRVTREDPRVGPETLGFDIGY